ncbi:DUF3558 domain-containing protein [Streptomyces pathocidini]|uniref:DUF3558 domain-containing protein n=1 Tax=Streptomyces pathocidini TaxID=1650571 RepID=A0ABW7UWJ7_9ACTN|nr:DUF3558 domain-containing protein [Streptomyces pathocidini]
MRRPVQRPTRPRLARLLACAAVAPAILVAGCSSGSDSSQDAAGGAASKSAGAKPSPTVEAAKYGKLPQPCEALAGKTVEELVPKAKSKSGTAGKSGDVQSRSTCSWNGLDGYQYRWLDVSFQRFESDATLGSGEKRAKDYFAKQIDATKSTQDAKDLKSGKGEGIGEESATFAYGLKKGKDDFRNQTVVARSANVIITLNYNGTGYEDAKQPNSADLLKDAEAAAKKAVEAVAAENEAGGKVGSATSGSKSPEPKSSSDK